MSKAAYWQRGETLDYTNGGNAKIEANQILVIGTKVAVAGTDIEVGEKGSVLVAGVYEFPKETSSNSDIGMGVDVYWDATNSKITTTPTSNTLAGYAAAPADKADTTILVKLLG